jgi:hypothetical protein
MYVTRQWLANFAYRIDSSVDAVLISTLVLIVILIGLLTYVSGRLAVTNPVNNLRHES